MAALSARTLRPPETLRAETNAKRNTENVMHPVLVRSFGGLSLRYYVRQLLLGLFFPVFFALKHGAMLLALPVHLQVVLVFNTLLYSYSRFVYESVTGYVIGDTVITFPFLVFAILTVFTMIFCWCFAILVAPVGLAWLYFRNG